MNKLITVHGINTDGAWQARVGDLLSQHFKHYPIRYPEYRRLGALKLLLDPSVLVLGIILFLAAFKSGQGLAVLLGIAFITLSLAHFFARRLREDALRRFKVQLDNICVDNSRVRRRRPHLIAHSFGTYLAGTALRRYPDVRLDSVILAGSVLSADFDWAGLDDGGNKFRRLRNEIARRDNVSRAAYFLHGLVPGMGQSGFFGFRGGYDLAGPYFACGQCGQQPSPLHNVLNKELGHSDYVFSIGYAYRFWLPFLWGLNARHYHDFVDQCDDVYELQLQGGWREVRVALDKFLSSSWVADDRTVEKYIDDEITEREAKGQLIGVPRRDLIVQTVWNVCQQMADARQEEETGVGANPTAFRSLNPITAVNNALNSVLEAERERQDKREKRDGAAT